VTIITK